MKFWGAVLLFLLSTTPALATFSFSLSSSDPASVSTKTQEILVNLSITDLPSSSYFRVAFQKQSGDSYFGQIKNHLGNWVDIGPLSSTCNNYYYISDTSASSAAILLRVGESSTANPGQYQLKAHRFTENSCSSTDAQNSLPVDLNFPAPTPTQAPQPTQVSSTNTPIPPSSTPKPTAVPTPKPTSTPKPSSTPTPLPLLGGMSESQPNLISLDQPERISPAHLPQSTPEVLGESTSFPWTPALMIGSGLVGLSVSAFLLLRKTPQD